MSIELQSPMKALFRMYKPITVALTSAISILCVQQKAIADDHVRIDKPEDETYGEFTNDSNYTTEYSEGEISQGHNRCLQAADYKGCMEYQEGSNTRITETGSEPGTVDVTEPKPYNYDPESVMQLKIRGSYGRYLTFIGKTVNEYTGTSGYMMPGSPGSVRCTTTPGFGVFQFIHDLQ